MRASLVVIPTYNESESITQILSALKPLDCDVLVIDDGSPDGTAQKVRDLGDEVLSLIHI
jgi:dolichol-phosphate mannosyltransferase